MTPRKMLFGARSGPFEVPPLEFMLYNGTSAVLDYDIGLAVSADRGLTWTPDAGNPILTKGAGGTWNDESIVQPSMFWDGSQWVLYLAGHDSSIWRLGRWTNPNADLDANPTAWTADPANPIFNPAGVITQFNLPTAILDGAIERIWYGLWKASGDITVGYAERSAGGVFSGVGEVFGLGSPGSYNDEETVPGAVIAIPGGFRIYVAGRSGTTDPMYRSGYIETTDPDDPTDYTDGGVMSGLDDIITLPGDGRTYLSNQVKSIRQHGDQWIAYCSAFHPVDASQDEVAFYVTGPDGLTWSDPQGPLLPLSGWTANSAENPSVAVMP